MLLASAATVATVAVLREELELPASIEDVQAVSNFRPPFTLTLLLMLVLPFDSFFTRVDDEAQVSADAGHTCEVELEVQREVEDEEVRRCPDVLLLVLVLPV